MQIREYRERVGMTQAELAMQLGKTQSAICQWESGVRAPRPAMLLRLADVLGCTVDELLRGDAEKTKNPA